MNKNSKLIAAGGILTLGLSLIYPKLRGSSKKDLKLLEIKENENPLLLDNLRGKEYCEIFTAYRNFGKMKIGIYNNINRRQMPLSLWEQQDTERIKKEKGAAAVVKNGPRFWVLDGIRGYSKGESAEFSGYEFDLVAIIEKKTSELKNDIQNRKLYTEQSIHRKTDWLYSKGEKVFELISDTGVIYTMQAASLEIKKDLEIKDLETFSGKLNLPDGWEYRVRRLDEDVCFEIRGEAHIIQDEYRNTYQRNPFSIKN